LVLGQCRDQQNRNGEAIWHQLTHRPNGLVLTNRILLYLYNDDDMSFYLVQISKVRSHMPHLKRMLTESLKECFSGNKIHRYPYIWINELYLTIHVVLVHLNLVISFSIGTLNDPTITALICNLTMTVHFSIWVRLFFSIITNLSAWMP
jgi:hypothetical protein